MNIGTENFAKAVSAIQRRAERQIDLDKLLSAFVASDLILRTDTDNTQLILGRRGSGKTHLIKVFEKNKLANSGTVYYFDCTGLGGDANYSNDDHLIATSYFISFLNDLGIKISKTIKNSPDKDIISNQEATEILSKGLPHYFLDDNSTVNKFNYRKLVDVLTDLLGYACTKRLYIVLDEWANIPVIAQPLFAEFLKRTILSIPAITLKIIAVNYQCEFMKVVNGQKLGLDRGADISDPVDFDAYFVYDEKKEFLLKFFAQVLYNHIAVELGETTDISEDEKARKINSWFSQKHTFKELVRASEGNCRDFLCIFAKSYFEGYRQESNSATISIKHVRDAAGSWYDQEKYANIRSEEEPIKTLNRILEGVLKGYKSRTFMVEHSKADHPRLIRLLNERILHKLNINYSNPDRPGERYELFTVDYGAYVKFQGTSIEPYQTVIVFAEDLLTFDEKEREYMVPLDDKRSIRRIVFDPSELVASDWRNLLGYI